MMRNNDIARGDRTTAAPARRGPRALAEVERRLAAAGIDVVEVERCPNPACSLCRAPAVAGAAGAAA